MVVTSSRLHAVRYKEALDRYIAERPAPKPSRSAAIRELLADHLVGLGILKLPK